MPVDGTVEHDFAIDHAFLHWFEARLASSDPEPPEEEVLDYFVAVALYDAGWLRASGD